MLDNIELEQLCACILNHKCYVCCAAGGKMQLPNQGRNYTKKPMRFKKKTTLCQ